MAAIASAGDVLRALDIERAPCMRAVPCLVGYVPGYGSLPPVGCPACRCYWCAAELAVALLQLAEAQPFHVERHRRRVRGRR